MGYRQTVEIQIRFIGIYVTRKKSEIYNLDQEISQSQNNCHSPDCQSILVHFLRCLALI